MRHRGDFNVILAKAGIQNSQWTASWIPAFAGMTRVLSKNSVVSADSNEVGER